MRSPALVVLIRRRLLAENLELSGAWRFEILVIVLEISPSCVDFQVVRQLLGLEVCLFQSFVVDADEVREELVEIGLGLFRLLQVLGFGSGKLGFFFLFPLLLGG